MTKRRTDETSLALRPEDRSELEAEAPRNAAALAQLESFVIAGPEDLVFAGDVLVQVVARWKDLEVKRTSITRPMLAAKRAVDELFDPVQKPLKQAEIVLRAKVAEYTIAERAAQAESMHALAAGESTTITIPAEAPAGVSVSGVWVPVIVDAAAVPREYCTPDTGKLQAAGRMVGTEHIPPDPIAGVEWRRLGTVRVRSSER